MTPDLDLKFALAVAGLTLGLVRIVRLLPALNTAKYKPFVPFIAQGISHLISLVGSWYWNPGLSGLSYAAFVVLHGIAAGLGACGLYSLGAKYLPGMTPPNGD
jgi:hypothetical protein